MISSKSIRAQSSQRERERERERERKRESDEEKEKEEQLWEGENCNLGNSEYKVFMISPATIKLFNLQI